MPNLLTYNGSYSFQALNSMLFLFNTLGNALPRVLNKNNMEFRAWNEYDPLYVSKFGILEPSAKNKKLVPQLFLAPLLAFDLNFNRLGYGRGYYDKYLSKNKNFLTYGIAFSFQQAKTIPVHKNDVVLKGVITEEGSVIN